MHYAHSALLVWNIAGAESHAGHATEIEPVHLMLGLCKLCDVSPAHLDDRVFQGSMSLREEFEHDLKTLQYLFEQIHIPPTSFRRRLRALAKKDGPSPTGHSTIHRSADCRVLFKRAEQLMQQQGGTSHPIRAHHLGLACLERDQTPWTVLYQEFDVQEVLEKARQAGLWSLLDGRTTGAPASGPSESAASPQSRLLRPISIALGEI
ncbi:MAG: hypothetical protein OJF50_005713 [Nitrospira sp.]|jgi:hypothetical protein|nr:hypothetical protein [Nitrospira sp.]